MDRLSEADAKKLITRISETGDTVFSQHAWEEMRKDGLDAGDVGNVLRAGVVQPGELEKGSWRYKVCTYTMTVVIAFRSESEMVIVTAWRDKKRSVR